MALEILLADADVLIDYRDSDLAVLALVSEHVGQVHVLTPVLQQVRDLDEARCRAHGIAIVEPHASELTATDTFADRLGFHDALCLATARRRDWTLVSNDGALRRACEQQSISTRRGLGLMLDLVASGHLTKTRALQVARLIHEANPLHIHQGVLREFEEGLG